MKIRRSESGQVPRRIADHDIDQNFRFLASQIRDVEREIVAGGGGLYLSAANLPPTIATGLRFQGDVLAMGEGADEGVAILDLDSRYVRIGQGGDPVPEHVHEPLTVGQYLAFAVGTSYIGNAPRQINTNATPTAVANTLVARNASGSFAAQIGTFADVVLGAGTGSPAPPGGGGGTANLTAGLGLTGGIYDTTQPREFAVVFGTAPGTVAEGNHIHSFTQITGALTTGQIPGLPWSKITSGVPPFARVDQGNTFAGGVTVEGVFTTIQRAQLSGGARLPDGTGAAPALAIGQDDLGFYRNAVGVLRVSGGMVVDGSFGVLGNIDIGGAANPWETGGNPRITFGGGAVQTPYSIMRSNTGWDKLNLYTQLLINWHTGIRIGGHSQYGGVRFYNDSPSIGGDQIFSVGDGDNNVRAAGFIYAQDFVLT
jgi:hypothetical protein